jgi:hypothetical protein
MTRAPSVLIWALALAPAAAIADENVVGIPPDVRMHTKALAVPDVGQTPASAALEIEDLASVRMVDRWTLRPHVLSPDGAVLLVHREDGFSLFLDGQRLDVGAPMPATGPRNARWSPDSQRLAYWVQPGHQIALLDLSRPREQWEPQWVYDPRAASIYTGRDQARDPLLRQPFGLEWSPTGEALLLGERLYDERDQMRETCLLRLDLDGSGVTSVVEVVRTPEEIGFFVPVAAPVGRPPGPGVLYGTHSGLYLARLDGITEPRRMRHAPSTGVWDVACDPASTRVSLLFRRPGFDRQGRRYVGLWDFDLARPARASGRQFDASQRAESLSYSPSGTYLTWSLPDELCYRRPDAPSGETVCLDMREAGEADVERVRGFAWHPSEDHLAFSAGATLYLHEVRSGKTRPVHTFSDDPDDFVAGLSWAGDRLILTWFEDMTPEQGRVN